jgi:release factor glutamine methyltransferase
LRIKEWLRNSALLLKEVTDIPQKEAMILLGEALQKEMSWIVAHGEDEMVVDERLESWMQRRAKHEPLEYIVGHADFYGKRFYVDARVLIPRPETEILVDKVVELAQNFDAPHIVEIGTGSGIISIMSALLLPKARITAVDLSLDALDVAKNNALLHGVAERIDFVQGSYLASIDEKIDLLVSNPPYIADNEPLGIGLSFEPSMALYGGERGDEMLCHIIDLYVEKKIQVLACEMGYDQRLPLARYAQEKGLDIHFYHDLADLDRGFWIKEKR